MRHLAECAVVEEKLGIARSVRGWLAAKRKALTKTKKVAAGPPDVSTGKTFYPTTSYLGAVSGYVFGTRLNQGFEELGYHADAPKKVAVPPTSDPTLPNLVEPDDSTIFDE